MTSLEITIFICFLSQIIYHLLWEFLCSILKSYMEYHIDDIIQLNAPMKQLFAENSRHKGYIDLTEVSR